MLTHALLLKRLEAGESFDYLFFWGHKVPADGVIGSTCLSQWYPAAFEVDGIPYPTAEHWMMACKARLFKDDEMLAEILAAPDPKTAKALGRKVASFEERVWKSHARELVTQGNLHKFGQNPELKAFLLSTGTRVFVEASPYDRIWGIGMSASHDDALNPRKWRGQNLLGFALMDVRQSIRDAGGMV